MALLLKTSRVSQIPRLFIIYCSTIANSICLLKFMYVTLGNSIFDVDVDLLYCIADIFVKD